MTMLALRLGMPLYMLCACYLTGPDNSAMPVNDVEAVTVGPRLLDPVEMEREEATLSSSRSAHSVGSSGAVSAGRN